MGYPNSWMVYKENPVKRYDLDDLGVPPMTFIGNLPTSVGIDLVKIRNHAM